MCVRLRARARVCLCAPEENRRQRTQFSVDGTSKQLHTRGSVRPWRSGRQSHTFHSLLPLAPRPFPSALVYRRGHCLAVHKFIAFSRQSAGGGRFPTQAVAVAGDFSSHRRNEANRHQPRCQKRTLYRSRGERCSFVIATAAKRAERWEVCSPRSECVRWHGFPHTFSIASSIFHHPN